MSKIWHIARKDIGIYYGSPMAFIVGAAFLILAGHFFVASITDPVPEASIRGVLNPLTFAVVLWGPIVSMRLLAEEQKLGTLELVLTAPVRDWQLVMGKYIALVFMFLGILVPTFVFPALLFWFADPDPGPIFSGYLGLLLLGISAAALGLFTSSLTHNQIIAGIIAAIALLFLTIAEQAGSVMGGLSGRLLTELSLTSHYLPFVRGVIDMANILYFVTFAALFLSMTTLNLESRRWR